MAGFATFLIIAVLCSGVNSKAGGNGEGQVTECPRDAAKLYYRTCASTQQRLPVRLTDAKGRPVTLYRDMSAATFTAYITAQCSQKKAAVMKCFSKFFSTPEGQKCVDPEPLTIEAQNTGGFCGAEGLGPIAEALLPLGKWNNGCLGSYHSNALYYCGQQNGSGMITSSGDLTSKMSCIIRMLSMGKAEDCGRRALLAYLLSYVASIADLGVTPDAAQLTTAIAAVPA